MSDDNTTSSEEFIRLLHNNGVNEQLTNILSNAVIEAFTKNHKDIPIGFYKECRARGIFNLKRRIEWNLKNKVTITISRMDSLS